MASCITNMILLTLPENLKEQGLKLIKECERPKKHPSMHGRFEGQESEEERMMRKSKKEAAVTAISIAEVVTKLWSVKMLRHAENLILQKGVKEGYLQEHHLKWVHILEDNEEATQDKGWLVDDQDDAIIELLWDTFNMKTHYSQVTSHRLWVQRSYDRLKSFVPSLCEEIVERHDLSKYAFSQAIGYTLKWVHNISHGIWRAACDFHLYNEPHHPQAWSEQHTEEEKRIKLQRWLSASCDSHTGCPYGLDLTCLDLTSGDFAEPFLFESYIDMVGVEWERKKGMDINISTRDLAYIEDRFLNRYTWKQHKVIADLIEKIVASDTS